VAIQAFEVHIAAKHQSLTLDCVVDLHTTKEAFRQSCPIPTRNIFGIIIIVDKKLNAFEYKQLVVLNQLRLCDHVILS